MEASDIYNGLARAVDATKPAQEYCFLWIPHWSTCMTKGEWSGWMQAIGSFAALILAVFIPHFQNWLSNKKSFFVAENLMIQLISFGVILDAHAKNSGNLLILLKNSNDQIIHMASSVSAVNVENLPYGCQRYWFSFCSSFHIMTRIGENSKSELMAQKVLKSHLDLSSKLLEGFRRHKPRLLFFKK